MTLIRVAITAKWSLKLISSRKDQVNFGAVTAMDPSLKNVRVGEVHKLLDFTTSAILFPIAHFL